MAKGWQKESKRHSFAARGIETHITPSQASLRSFSKPVLYRQFGSQLGDSPFKYEVKSSWKWLDDIENAVLQRKRFDKTVKLEWMPIDTFISIEYNIVKKNHGFWVSPDPEISKWASIESDTVKEYAKAMQAGSLAPAPTIDKDSHGETYGADGKHRALAAKRLGFEFVPVLVFRDREIV